MSFPKTVYNWVIETANWPYLGGSRKFTGTCPRCQGEISAKAKICPKCGEPLPGRKPTFRNGPHTIMIRLAALAVFLLIIAWLISRL